MSARRETTAALETSRGHELSVRPGMDPNNDGATGPGAAPRARVTAPADAGLGPSRMTGVLRAVLLVGVTLAAIAAVGWATGFRLTAGMAFSALCVAVLLAVLEAGLRSWPPVQWPDPTPAPMQNWFGIDRGVRRLASAVEMAESHGDDAGLRAVLRAEAERRLAAHHSANPNTDRPAADPLESPLVHPDLRRALDGGRITRRNLPTLIAHLEDL